MAVNTETKQSSISEFYKGRSIFVTGATGFMGKVLVEKLLRACPGIERVYLLMRPSRDQTVDCRLQGLIENQVRVSKDFPLPSVKSTLQYIGVIKHSITRVVHV